MWRAVLSNDAMARQHNAIVCIMCEAHFMGRHKDRGALLFEFGHHVQHLAHQHRAKHLSLIRLLCPRIALQLHKHNVYASRAYMRKRYVGCVLSQHGAKRILQCVDLNDRQSGNRDFPT